MHIIHVPDLSDLHRRPENREPTVFRGLWTECGQDCEPAVHRALGRGYLGVHRGLPSRDIHADCSVHVRICRETAALLTFYKLVVCGLGVDASTSSKTDLVLVCGYCSRQLFVQRKGWEGLLEHACSEPQSQKS